MSPDEIQHFLIAFDPVGGKTKVHSFGSDYGAAQAAYAKAEGGQARGEESNLDIVLISADSLETIEQTHSSYFKSGMVELAELLPG